MCVCVRARVCDLLHVPTTSMRSSDEVAAPSSWTRNSVLIRREASCSLSDRCERSESISSMKITAGWYTPATANSARTIFSPSPTWTKVKREDIVPSKDTLMCVVCVACAHPFGGE